jgi:hypothetical protein
MKDMKKKMETYKQLADPVSEKAEVKADILQEKRKKTFYFVVRQPFDNYKQGDHVLDPDEIERIEKQRLLSLVMKVNL